MHIFRDQIVLCLTILALAFLFYVVSVRTNTVNKESFEYRYHIGLVKINQYLSELNNQCRKGETDIAHNTFLELRQHWQRLDVIVLASHNSGLPKIYFPSDSLKNLEFYLNKLKMYETGDTAIFSVLKEIKRINEKIDRIEIQGKP
jgi:predicted ATP-dependent Lon-type protease